MIIVCPTCSASYEIPASSLGATGRSVRCTECKTVWFNPPEENDEIISERGAKKSPAVVTLPAQKSAASSSVASGEEAASDSVNKGDVPAVSSSSSGVARRKSVPAAAIHKDEAINETDIEAVFSEVAQTSENKLSAELKAEKRGWFRRKARTAAVSSPRTGHADSHKATKTPLWMTLCLLCAIGGLFWLVAKRDSVAAFLPEMAHLYAMAGLKVNVQGLDIQNIKTLETMQNGTPLLVIEGVIKNVTTHGVDIPRLRLAVQTENGRELFAWTAVPAVPKLEQGGEIPFKAQLASPPLEGKKVAVRFTTRHDNLMRKE